MNIIYFYANKLQVGFPATQFCQKVFMGSDSSIILQPIR